jgi:hypothetical protein
MNHLLDRVALTLILSSSLTLGACASAASDGTNRSRDVITFAELQQEELSSFSAHQVIGKLRPNWLRSRGTTMTGQFFAVVFVDGVHMGDLDVLGSLPASEVEEIRFRSAGDATTRYGTGYPGGTIEVATRHRDPTDFDARWIRRSQPRASLGWAR